MATANDRYQDALIRRALESDRLEDATRRRVLRILNGTEADLTSVMRRRLEDTTLSASTLATLRFQNMLAEIDAIRVAAWDESNAAIRDDLFALSKLSASQTVDDLIAAVGIDLDLTLPSAAALRSIVTSQPFRGRLLREWTSGLKRKDLRQIEDALNIGLVEGEGIDAIVRRVVGTRANKFKDGILEISRRDATAIIRTASAFVSNAAREAVWDANADIILALRWTSVLDGRTTPICQSRDGKVVAVGGTPEELSGFEMLVPQDARPPAHFSCRAIMTAILDSEGVVGNRPTVTDTSGRKDREVRFRDDARRKAGSRWDTLDRRQRNALVKKERTDWALERVGGVPAETTYQQFLSRQSAAFQDDLLGATRGALFRRGGLTVDDLVTSAGRRIPLAELRRKHPGAFARAGIVDEAA